MFIQFILILLRSQLIQARIKVEILGMNVTFDTKYIKTNYSLEYNEGSQDFYMTIESDFLETFEHLYSRLYLARYAKNSTIPGEKLFDVRTDVCRFFKKQNGSDRLNRLLIELVQKFGTQVESCPLKSGHYFVRNFTFNVIKIPLESYFIKDFDAIGVLELQIKENKRFITIETVSTTLRFKNV